MPDMLLDRIKEVSPTLALIVVIALGCGGIAMWFQDGALKEPGHDRDRLVRSLRLGGDLRRHYVFWVTRALNRVDRFLGDDGKAEWSLHVRLIGNHGPAPYWTSWSFDKCAQLAVVYPIAAVFLTWVWAGEAGELGDALSFTVGTSSWRRGIALVFLIGCIISSIKSARASGWRRVPAAAVAVAFGVAGGVAGAGGLVVAAAFAVAYALAGSGVGVGVVAAGVAMGVVVGVQDRFSISISIVVVVVIVVVVFLVVLLAERARAKQRLGSFWLTYWPVALGACYLSVWGMGRCDVSAGPQFLLVMLGMVPLVNVPFDWASVGFTRALLRRGCERGAPSPLWLGLLDFAIGLMLLVLLAAALVVALHAVDWISRHTENRELINLPGRLLSLVQRPRDAENWWVYLTLFSTLIPSALNLLIGMFSLVTVAFPLQRHWLLATIPRLQKEGWDGTRKKVLALLAAQSFLGVCGAGLAVWAVVAALLYLGQYVRFGFLYEAVLLEWLLPT